MTVYYGNSFSETAMTLTGWESIIEAIRSGNNGLKDTIVRLRKVAALDKSVYNEMKKHLPWICGGKFREGVRQLSHFKGIHYLVLDFDHFRDENEPAAIKENLKRDKRVFAAFISPGGNGLKVIFKLNGGFETPKHYSDFYKSFAASFSKDYQLSEFCDLVTSDATRVCFLSYDPEVYYNPDGVCVEPPMNIFDFFGEVDDTDTGKVVDDKPELKSGHPGVDALRSIREKLLQNPPRPKPAKHYFVPEEVLAHLSLLKSTLAEYDLKLVSHTDVQYGIKLLISPAAGGVTAVINLYYGKKGFSVVLVPTKQSNIPLGELAVKVVWHSIHNRYTETCKVIPLQKYGN